MGWPLCWVLQGFWVGIVMQVRAGYRLGQWRGLLAVGFWWLGQWQWGSILWEMVSKQALGALPLFLFHYPPQL